MWKVWASCFSKQTGSDSVVMSKTKRDNWSPFPGCPLPVFQDKLAHVNARQTHFYPQEMPYTRTRLETKDDVVLPSTQCRSSQFLAVLE